MTSQEPLFEQLRDEFPGICVTESPTGRECHYGVQFCGIRESEAGSGTCGFHRVPDGDRGVYITSKGRHLSRAEQELLLVLNQHRVRCPESGALVQALIDAGWRRDGLTEADYDRTA